MVNEVKKQKTIDEYIKKGSAEIKEKLKSDNFEQNIINNIESSLNRDKAVRHESFKRALISEFGEDIATCIGIAIQNDSQNLLEKYKELDVDESVIEFLRKLIIRYGLHVNSAMLFSTQPNFWSHINTTRLKRGDELLFQNVVLRGDGEVINFVSTTASTLTLVNHFLKQLKDINKEFLDEIDHEIKKAYKKESKELLKKL